MATEKSGNEAAEPKAAQRAAEQPAPDTFSPDFLIANAPALLGVDPHVAVGGLHGVRDELSVDDARSKVERWLCQPVEEG